LIEPKDDGCCDADGGHEYVGASVVTGVDAAPVPEFAEHVLDPVALAIEHSVVGIGILRLTFDGMQVAMPRSVRAARNQSAS
jgi:hypothetical protein